MNKKILFLLPIFSLFIMGNTIKEESISVTVGEVDAPVYNMQVTWNKMEFTYVETINYIWDNNSHTYDLSDSTYKWSSEENMVTIKNNSAMSVNIELEYAGINKEITGQFDISEATINSNKSINSKLTLGGKLSETNTSYTKVGSINLKIS